MQSALSLSLQLDAEVPQCAMAGGKKSKLCIWEVLGSKWWSRLHLGGSKSTPLKDPTFSS
eukprot:129380-Karenia_brevis.AAC.1